MYIDLLKSIRTVKYKLNLTWDVLCSSAITSNHGCSDITYNHGCNAITSNHGCSAIAYNHGNSAITCNHGCSAITSNHKRKYVLDNYRKLQPFGIEFFEPILANLQEEVSKLNLLLPKIVDIKSEVSNTGDTEDN